MYCFFFSFLPRRMATDLCLEWCWLSFTPKINDMVKHDHHCIYHRNGHGRINTTRVIWRYVQVACWERCWSTSCPRQQNSQIIVGFVKRLYLLVSRLVLIMPILADRQEPPETRSDVSQSNDAMLGRPLLILHLAQWNLHICFNLSPLFPDN